MIIRAVILLLLILTLYSASKASYISAKASVAQYLLSTAWTASLAQDQSVKPWPWADTWPVARLSVPTLNTTLIVLEGASGEALAFGPGRIPGSADSLHGIFAIGGHRDTHLALLEHTVNGTEFELQLADGQVQRYRQTRAEIVDIQTEEFSINNEGAGLVLVTCYPFRPDQTGGPLRYVVTAAPI